MTDAAERARQRAIAVAVINDFNYSRAGYIPPTAIPAIAQAIRDAETEARAEEREECAKVAEGFTGHQDEDIRKMGLPTQGEAVAAAIRAGAEKEG